MKKILLVVLVITFVLGMVGYVAARGGHHGGGHHHRYGHPYGPPPPQCFVATAVYGEEAGETFILRDFRDECLLKSNAGKKLVEIYYQEGPKAAKVIDEHKYLKPVTKVIMLPLVGTAHISTDLTKFLTW